MFQRITAFILALGVSATALAMLFAPRAWYDVFPGVLETGPYNAHLIRDVGCAFFTEAGVLFVYAFARKPPISALLAVTAFVSLHAVVHLGELSMTGEDTGHVLVRDLLAVYLPVFLTIWFCISAARTSARLDVAPVPLHSISPVHSREPMEKHS